MSSIHPTIAGQVLGLSNNSNHEIEPANDQRTQMLEKLKSDAVALLRRLETASADIDLKGR